MIFIFLIAMAVLFWFGLVALIVIGLFVLERKGIIVWRDR